MHDLLTFVQFQAKRRDDYFIAFGKFIEQFSMAELALFLLLSRYAKVSTPIARAVFSGARTEASVKFIKRIWQVDRTPMKIRNELTKVFTQLSFINDVRNLIVHNGTTEDYLTGERTASDAIIALLPSKTRSHQITAIKLTMMTKDTQKIFHHFVSLYGHPKTSLERRAKIWPDLLDAWLYMPPPERRQSRKKRRSKAHKSGQVQTRPPQ